MQNRLNAGVGVLVVLGLCVAGVANAEPGDGINVNGWKISPKLGLDVTRDSNVYSLSSGKKGDTYFDANAGLDVDYKGGMLQLDGGIFIGRRTYSKETDLNFTTAGENLGVTLQEKDNWKFDVSESFRRVQDIDQNALNTINIGGISSASVLDSSSRSKRDVAQVAVGAAKAITEKVGMEAGYRYDSVKYVDGGLYDLSGNTVELEGAMKATDKTAAILTGVYGNQHSKGLDKDPDYIAGRVGFKTIGSDKVVFKGGIGAEEYKRTGVGKSNESLVNYDLIGTWKATDKVSVDLGARNGVQMSSAYADNPAKFNMVWVDGVVQVMPTTTLMAGLSYRNDAYLDKVDAGSGVMMDRTDKGSSARVRADYAPAGLKFVKLFGEVLYESVKSDISDYNDSRVTIGANLQY